jgi:hypothetical protein
MASYDTLTVASHAAPLDIMRLTPSELNGGPQTFPHDLDFQGDHFLYEPDNAETLEFHR